MENKHKTKPPPILPSHTTCQCLKDRSNMSSGRPIELRERRDSEEVLSTKYGKLVDIVANARSIVFMSGAGISTSCGVGDFQGDKGLRKTGVLGVQEHKLDYTFPSYAHRAIAALVKEEETTRASFCVTSNHDNMHAKAGTLPDKLAELFGNAYVEDCLRCGARYTRSVIVPPIKRTCDDPECGGRLKRLGVRYGEMVPEAPLAAACQALADADLVIVLGSSLQTYMFHHLDLGPKMVIANLQPTPFDQQAKLVVADTTDAFMQALMDSCFPSIPVPEHIYTQSGSVSLSLSGSELEICLTGAAPNEPFTAASSVSVLADGRQTELDRHMFTHAWTTTITLSEDCTHVVLCMEPFPEYGAPSDTEWHLSLPDPAVVVTHTVQFVLPESQRLSPS